LSIVVSVYVPGGIVMAADSRLCVVRHHAAGRDGEQPQAERLVLSDSANKVIYLSTCRAGILTYDTGIIENESIESHLLQFEQEQVEPDTPIEELAGRLRRCFRNRIPRIPVGFIIAGYQREGRLATPFVFAHHTVHGDGEIRRVNLGPDKKIKYGVIRAGETSIINRLISPDHLPLFGAMPVPDAIDYASFLIRTTIDAQRFEPRFPTCGGAVDILLLQPDGGRFVSRKRLDRPH